MSFWQGGYDYSIKPGHDKSDKGPLWPWIVGGSVLLTGSILIYWIYFRQRK